MFTVAQQLSVNDAIWHGRLSNCSYPEDVAREERRRYQRVTLPSPLRGSVNAAKVYVLDVSVTGVRVAHQDALPARDQGCVLTFDGRSGPVILDCKVEWTTTHRRAAHANDRSVFHSGLRIAAARARSDDALRELIAYFVERALDEQRANAQGIPATAALSFQSGKGTEFVKFELFAGRWKRTPTTDGKQPISGFTVSAAEGDDNIATLCQTYESADADTRKLIRAMAELSISRAEGVPTRRYEP
jgi:hypothetical protein